MWLGSSLVVDLMITALMAKIVCVPVSVHDYMSTECHLQLFKAKASTTIGRTSSILSKLITVTVETGLTVTVGASIQLFLFMLCNAKDLHFLP
jgi:hypothetical protein